MFLTVALWLLEQFCKATKPVYNIAPFFQQVPPGCDHLRQPDEAVRPGHLALVPGGHRGHLGLRRPRPQDVHQARDAAGGRRARAELGKLLHLPILQGGSQH